LALSEAAKACYTGSEHVKDVAALAIAKVDVKAPRIPEFIRQQIVTEHAIEHQGTVGQFKVPPSTEKALLSANTSVDDTVRKTNSYSMSA
jgi:hypothetical protein